jgi:hypothetical protein
MNSPLGVLRTVPQQPLDEPGRYSDQSPRSWDVIPGRKVCNDGVYPAILLPGLAYHLAHDGTGWQLVPEGTRPHAYLTDDALQPVVKMELAHRPLVLDPGCRYSIEQDGTGAWHLLEHAESPCPAGAGA